ncbi:CoA-transferase family III [Lepidopterella palustris CBS 459.81]|uniref:CoA-transferase family III n=1 Tax=Lepidopterella palustris CBS 459.81 TaxID=1314670 RepID=A0A8E2E6T4_9PEZI|nr:CoA-transferase family III [Lepidopterella palustris CBS 459.81]
MPSISPLTGVRVLEFAGLAPGTFCGLLLSSYGASQFGSLTVDRPGSVATRDALTSYKSSIALDLKNRSYLAILTSLIPSTDILIDPFRPSMLEKSMAGRDINYLAVSGVLSMLGVHRGGMVAFIGVLLALFHRSASGRGQAMEANMVDGVNFLATYSRLASKAPLILSGVRESNALNGGVPCYACYDCKDASRYMSVGAPEPQFFAVLLKGLGLSAEEIVPGKEVFLQRFQTKTRKEWESIFDGIDACCAPVLEMNEMEAGWYDQRPAVGSRESPARPIDMAWHGNPVKPGQGGEEALKGWAGWQKGKHFAVQAGALVWLK